MPDLLGKALPLIPFALIPALLLLLAPLGSRRARLATASVLGVFALGFVVDVLATDHSQALTLAVPNFFPRGPEGEPHQWTTETVTAPAWHYHLWLAAMLLLPAVLLFARAGRAPGTPSPVLHGAGVFLYYLVLRLGLEKTAAHDVIVWATGSAVAMLLILPFFGWYCGRRGYGFGRFAGQLLLLALLQRLPLIAIAGAATMLHLGTHLDTHVVEDIWMPGAGSKPLASDFERWFYPTVFPHLTIWVLLTIVAGLLLGVLPFILARRRQATAVAPATLLELGPED
jgi:hypothetical protein